MEKQLDACRDDAFEALSGGQAGEIRNHGGYADNEEDLEQTTKILEASAGDAVAKKIVSDIIDYYRLDALERIKTATNPAEICTELQSFINDQKQQFGDSTTAADTEVVQYVLDEQVSETATKRMSTLLHSSASTDRARHTTLCENFCIANGLTLLLKCMRDNPTNAGVLANGCDIFILLFPYTCLQEKTLFVTVLLYFDHFEQVAMHAVRGEPHDSANFRLVILFLLEQMTNPLTRAECRCLLAEEEFRRVLDTCCNTAGAETLIERGLFLISSQMVSENSREIMWRRLIGFLFLLREYMNEEIPGLLLRFNENVEATSGSRDEVRRLLGKIRDQSGL